MAIGSDRIMLRFMFTADGAGTKPKGAFASLASAADRLADKVIKKPVAEACGEVEKILGDTTASVISRVARIASVYRRAGMSQSEAFLRAWRVVKSSAAEAERAVGSYLSGLDEIRKYPDGGGTGGYTLPGVTPETGADSAVSISDAALSGIQRRISAVADAVSGLVSTLRAAVVVLTASFGVFTGVVAAELRALRDSVLATGGSLGAASAAAAAMAAFISGAFVTAVTGASGVLGLLRDGAVSLGAHLNGAFSAAVTGASGVLGLLREGAVSLGAHLDGAFSAAVGGVCTLISGAGVTVGALRGALGGLLGFITDSFLVGWRRVWTSAAEAFSGVFGTLADGARRPLNLIIGFVNTLSSGIASAVNALAGAIGGMSFEIPDWVPGLGGKRLGLDFPTVTAPKLPYLASGAVIPPRAPFLAVLGDQRHGTNVEAPLSTIADALRGVLAETSGASGAGSYRFTAQINRRTLFDEVISEAKLRQGTTGRNPFAI